VDQRRGKQLPMVVHERNDGASMGKSIMYLWFGY
jgi:hypothetical protein